MAAPVFRARAPNSPSVPTASPGLASVRTSDPDTADYCTMVKRAGLTLPPARRKWSRIAGIGESLRVAGGAFGGPKDGHKPGNATMDQLA